MQALGVSRASSSLAAAATSQPLCTFTNRSPLVAISQVPTATGHGNLLMLCDEGSQITLV